VFVYSVCVMLNWNCYYVKTSMYFIVYVCLNATTFSAQQTLDVFVIYDYDNMLNIVDIR